MYILRIAIPISICDGCVVSLTLPNTGHFPWLMKLFSKDLISYTEMGKAFNYIAKVALDLIKARRQGGHNEKVNMHTIVTIIYGITAL
jgi:hypothetical protein